MGLLVTGVNAAPDGTPIPSVYLRILTIHLNTPTSATPTATLMLATYASREGYLAGDPGLHPDRFPTSVGFQGPLADCIRFDILYPHVQQQLEGYGYTCTPVLETTPEASPGSSE
jgi:hypothetical protein